MHELTTGQMIDKLKVGEVAECVEKGITEVIRDDDGIWWYDKPSGIKKSYMTLLSRNLDLKWRILPNYVTFEEAMQALKEGKKVKVIYQKGDHDYIYSKNRDVDFRSTTWNELFEGKWTIEESNHE